MLYRTRVLYNFSPVFVLMKAIPAPLEANSDAALHNQANHPWQPAFVYSGR
jgi:hypothetical protein